MEYVHLFFQVVESSVYARPPDARSPKVSKTQYDFTYIYML